MIRDRWSTCRRGAMPALVSGLCLAAVTAGTLVAPAPAYAWNTAEHMRLCDALELPPAFAGVPIYGFTVPEWCSMPDYERSVRGIVQDGMCSGYRGWTDEWWAEYAAAGPCADIWALNNSHFGGFAYSHWRYYHELALLAAARWAERCTPGCYGVSLVLEGFGLHFLTDAFSAGHTFNPLGDFETQDQQDVQYYSSTSSLPNLLYPPPGGINVFRQDLHSWLNEANDLGVTPAVQFADGFAGPLVIGDKLLPGLDELAADQQATWALQRSRAAILDVWWALLGVRGEGGCVVTNMCTADYDQPSPGQGDAWRCVPFLANASWDQALTALGANEGALASWGDCTAMDPAGHDCAWSTSARSQPSWPGSLDPEVDDLETLALLGCDVADEQVYDEGRCAAGLGADEVRATVCDAHAAGECDFTGSCDLPWGVAADPDGGTTTTPDCGCQAAPHAPVPLASGLVFLLGGLLLGRRRRARP